MNSERLTIKTFDTKMKYFTILFISLFFIVSCESKTKENQEYPILSDTELRKHLEAFGDKDQKYRVQIDEVIDQYGLNSLEAQQLSDLIAKNDSILCNLVVKIIDQYGWLGKSRIGEEANHNLWLIIQHAPLEVQEKYLPLLRQSVKENESFPQDLAYLEDRLLMRKKLPQIYGTQATMDPTSGKISIYEIKDVEHVNERRQKIGLGTIEEYSESNGYTFGQRVP